MCSRGARLHHAWCARICTAYRCTPNATNGSKVCRKHSTDKGTCSAEGCSSTARVRGLCIAPCWTQEGLLYCRVWYRCQSSWMSPHGAFFWVLLVRQAIALLQLDLQKKKGNCYKYSGHGSENVHKTKGCTTLARAATLVRG